MQSTRRASSSQKGPDTFFAAHWLIFTAVARHSVQNPSEKQTRRKSPAERLTWAVRFRDRRFPVADRGTDSESARVSPILPRPTLRKVANPWLGVRATDNSAVWRRPNRLGNCGSRRGRCPATDETHRIRSLGFDRGTNRGQVAKPGFGTAFATAETRTCRQVRGPQKRLLPWRHLCRLNDLIGVTRRSGLKGRDDGGKTTGRISG